MALYCLLGTFFLCLNIIFSASVKAENAFEISDSLRRETSSGIYASYGKTQSFGLGREKIHKSECDCGYRALACRLREGGGNVCLCDEGYAQKKEKCEQCYCGRDDRASKCSFKNDKKICICSKGYAEKHEMCETCSCGQGSEGCSFVNDKKYCHCGRRYAEKNGYCEKCECGDILSFSSCSFNATDHKTCNCANGYVQRNMTCSKMCERNSDCLNEGICIDEENGKFCRCAKGFKGDKCEIIEACEAIQESCDAIRAVCKFNEGRRKAFCECPTDTAFNNEKKVCQECYCAGHAICSFENGYKTCSCEKGYALNGDKCEECNCGKLQERCHFRDNMKVCTCRKGASYSPGSETCEKCWCGHQATSCELNFNNYTRCTCRKGYVAERSYSYLYGNEMCIESDSVAVYWRYATFALIGLVVIILFSCTLMVCCKRKTSKGAVLCDGECKNDIELSSTTSTENV